MTRKSIYGAKKQFIFEHLEDIKALRRRNSAREVAEIYKGLISLWDVYNIEKLFRKISKK